ncbi:hypothetical protein L226DRAFT_208140 [Lentinus tigrinus ALCF2SS1-7]|uniref:uncharacterized protein n=1 Tax=Lentinus tigrinus ALCF2SS1-7 TaxID=1328758 RepID=UPI001166223F|nr:hypothetical protein L226DRAFT_208140 [Lentinus tigrinus ALCF2SS1-7]
MKGVHMSLVVVQCDPAGGQLRRTLSYFPWKKLYSEKKVRKGFWRHGYSGTVRVEISLPDAPALPLFAKIPYIIDVITTTAPLTRGQANAHPAHKAIFPPPPTTSSELTFNLIRRTVLLAKGRYDSGDIEAAWFLGFARRTADLETDLLEKEWVTVDDAPRSGAEERGMWVKWARF